MNSPTQAPVQVLHTHSTMSILDGASSISSYLKYCKDNSLVGCGITDHGWLIGLYELIEQAPKFGVKPVPGVEFYLMPRSDHEFQKEGGYKYFHITVWAKNMAGYRSLLSLANRSWSPERPAQLPFGRKVPRITFEDLAVCNEGLIIGSGCIEGPFGKPIRFGEDKEAATNLSILWEIFKGRMFFEIMPHGVKDNFVYQDLVIAEYREDDGTQRELRFHPTDQILTDQGWMSALEISKQNTRVETISAATPIRVHDHLLPDCLGAIGLCETSAKGMTLVPSTQVVTALPIDSWRTRNGWFVGNECSAACSNGCIQRLVNDKVIRAAHDLKAPLLLTLDAHFVKPADKAVQDILLKNGRKDGWHFNTVYNQMDTSVAWNNWERHHNDVFRFEQAFQEGVENNTNLIDMVEPIVLKKDYHLPEVSVPHDISQSVEGYDAQLMMLVSQRIAYHGRLPMDGRLPEYMARLNRELQVITNNGKFNFLPYFLVIDQEITSYSKAVGKLVGHGRGSAAGCLLSYLLGITHVDPIVWNLSFERFLSLGRINRGKFPDIDLDFGDPKIVVNHLSDKYGSKFARISTTTTMKLKGAIRDVCRILLDTKEHASAMEEVDRVCATIQSAPQGMDDRKWLYGYSDDDGEVHEGHLTQNPDLLKFFAAHPEVQQMVDEVLSVPRSVGRHASAYCLSDVPVSDLVPMCVVNEESCTQFTMGPVDRLGLIKMDFLGLNTLNDIAGAVKLIKARHNIDIDIYNLPLDDPKVFAAFCEGRTETVFQFKTSVGRQLCQQIRPKSVEDLAAITANGRPGTMYAVLEDGTTLIDAWVSRRQGRSPVTYVHPDLEEILKVTDGIFTYQEQVMQTFMKCCGWSEERADEVREIIGKKQRDKMEVLLPEISATLINRGWTKPQAETFLSLCKAASNYSFNRSHSVSYALLGYTCQWLKCNYPFEWWVSVLNNGSHQDLEESAQFVQEFVLHPDVNASDVEFYIISDGLGKIVFPLSRIKHVANAGAVVVEERKKSAFKNLEDFYTRINKRIVNKRIMLGLIFSGAFDRLCGIKKKTDRLGIVKEYFELRKEPIPKELAEADEADIIGYEDEFLAIGDADFTNFLLRKTRKTKMISPGDLRNGFGKGEIKADSHVTLGGIISRIFQTVTKKKKEPMAFLDVRNKSDTVSVTLFPREFARYKDKLKEEELIVVDGSVNYFNGKLGLLAEEIFIYRDNAKKLAELTTE